MHDEPEQHRRDEELRTELTRHGYRVITIRYDRDLTAQIHEAQEIFG
ncbi:hypothetical protein [Chloroflexus sp.]|nr:hypothetical protein [Chloroflexus sp.]